MNQELSIDLPSSISELLTPDTFAGYTVEGSAGGNKSRLQSLTVTDLFGSNVKSDDHAQCCISGLWLLHNCLDESHEISQDIHTVEGSFWHAIMHRLEGDFWNSKYWYRKVGNHPAFENIAPGWDPEEYVDACEKANNQGAAIQEVAVSEWKALFTYCFNNAS